MKTTNSMYEQPKKLPKGRSFSQTKPAPPLKGMAGFPRFARIGGKVSCGGGGGAKL